MAEAISRPVFTMRNAFIPRSRFYYPSNEGGGGGGGKRFGYDGKRASETLIISSGKFVDRGEGGPIPPRVLIEYVAK